jgi:uncharacterized membrane protein YheB (UPF0754 family)
MMSSVIAYGSIPVISGFIGWVTNLIAVKMIFRPRKPIRFFGFTIVGLIPKRRSDLARKIGETIERELISHRDIQNLINTPLFHDEVANLLGKKIDDFIKLHLGSNPLIGMFLSATVTGSIRDVLVKEIQKMIPDTMELMFNRVEVNLDFKEIVRQRIEEFDMSKLEDIIYGIASKELKAIEWYGGVLGFAVGLIQVAIVFFMKSRM